MKICSTCKQTKPLNDFHKKSSAKDGLQSKCKDCNKAGAREWQGENPDKYEVIWRRNGYGDDARLRRRARRYGVAVEELRSLIEISNGVCQVCGREPGVHGLVVDHCHRSMKVRGLLCGKCNTALGLFDDNIEYMKKAIEYLSK